MSTLFGGAAASSTTSTTGDTSKDVEIPQGQLPTDSISDLSFSPTNDFLAVASWDKSVRIYDVVNGVATGKWMFQCQSLAGGAPENPLCLSWSKVCCAPQTVQRVKESLTLTVCRMEHASQPAVTKAPSTTSTYEPQAMAAKSRSRTAGNRIRPA
jgi:WD40 repeat protein